MLFSNSSAICKTTLKFRVFYAILPDFIYVCKFLSNIIYIHILGLCLFQKKLRENQRK